MFTKEFDFFMGAVLLVLAVVFFLGKGEGVLDAFDTRRAWKKDLDAEQIMKYQRACAVFCLVLGLVEIAMGVFYGTVMGLISVAAAILSIAGLVLYIKKLRG